jgi:hypothetical protein
VFSSSDLPASLGIGKPQPTADRGFRFLQIQANAWRRGDSPSPETTSLRDDAGSFAALTLSPAER